MVNSKIRNISMSLSWAIAACLVFNSWSSLAITVEETCLGFTHPSHLTSMKSATYEKRYKNCKYVVGSVVLEYSDWFREASAAKNFVRNIEVVTGYVEFVGAWYTNYSEVFPNLKVIRGESLKEEMWDDPEYALLISHQGNANFTIEFPKLREISRGDIKIDTTHRMCPLENMNWAAILGGYSAEFQQHPEFYYGRVQNESSPECRCHPNYSNTGRWTWRENECQNISKLNCSPACRGGCYGLSLPSGCCHSSCVGGCTGPTRRDCFICRNVEYGGECRDFCPPGMHSFGVNCVNSCPEDSLIDEGSKSCLSQCPPNKTARKGKCVRKPLYIKKCSAHPFHLERAPDNSSMRSLDSPLWLTKHFRDCTVYEGDLVIECQWCYLDGEEIDPNGKQPLVLITSVLNSFRTLKKVTGTIKIKDVNFRTLTSFKNLEEIGGDLIIMETGIQKIEFPALRSVGGKIEISNNENLCYVHSLNLSHVEILVEHRKDAVQIFRNGDPAKCMQNGDICSDECFGNGCWGPGADTCLCLEYLQEGRCVSNCDWDRDYLRDGRHCVKTCTQDRYQLNGECLDCHENCRDGCTGPNATVGENGCNSCYKAFFREENIVCMKDGEDCPPGHIFSSARKSSQHVADSICLPEAFIVSSGMIFLAIVAAIIFILCIVFYCRKYSHNRAQLPNANLTRTSDKIRSAQKSPYSAVVKSDL